MNPIVVIAANAFQEARTNKVLHIAGIFSALLIIFSYFLGEVSLYQNLKVVKDVGMASISLFGLFVAIFLGATSLYREVELRTIYTIASKPVSRAQILLGKFVGMLAVLTSIVFLMTVFLFLITFTLEYRIDFGLLPAIALILLELWIAAAMAVLFSSFSGPFLTGFFTFGGIAVGRVAFELGQFGERSDNPIFKYFAIGVQKVFDLEAFNLRTEVVHQLPIYSKDIYLPLIYALFVISLLLGIAYLSFRKRDFK